MEIIVLLGRVLFSAIFILASFGHFSQGSIDHAASQGLPYASILVPLSGIITFLGGLSIVLGYKARLGAWLLVIFLVPVTFTMHKFWGVADSAVTEIQKIMFLKNLSMLGGAFLIAHFGSGPLSLDNLQKDIDRK